MDEIVLPMFNCRRSGPMVSRLMAHIPSSISISTQKVGLITSSTMGVSESGGGTYAQASLPMGYAMARKMVRKSPAKVELVM